MPIVLQSSLTNTLTTILRSLIYLEMPLIPKEQEDRKSEGTEGTDVEEPFSPSTAVAKETFDISTESQISTSFSHSPPEPISPSKEQELKEEVSPVYDTVQKKPSLGQSPTDIIKEEYVLEEDDENDEKSSSSVYDSTVIEKMATTNALESSVTESFKQDSAELSVDREHSAMEHSQRIEFLSFDNIGFAGKDRIDVEKQAHEMEDGEALASLEREFFTDEDATKTPVAEQSIDLPVSEPHEDIDRAFKASVIDSIVERCVHDLTVDIAHEIDINESSMEMTSSRFRIGQIEYQAEPDMQDSTDSMETVMEHKSATRTISSESSSDTMVASTMTSSYTTAPASVEPFSLEHTDDVQSEYLETSYQDRDDVDHTLPTTQTTEETLIDVVITEEKRESPVSIDRTESASLDSEELEEPYGDQKEELLAEMQVNIAPSPIPPVELQEHHVSTEHEHELLSEGEDDKGIAKESADDYVQRPEPPSLKEAKQIESISSEEPVKTSSSSDTSAEPTLLAATYDLESGAISRVVASYDISPDTIEKTLTVDTQPKAILSSPEDEVFETDLLAARARDEETPSEHEKTIEEVSLKTKTPDEEIDEDFELVTESDLAGYDAYYSSKPDEGGKYEDETLPDDEISMPDYPAPQPPQDVPRTEETDSKSPVISHPEEIQLPTRQSRSVEDESPSFDQSSPISSSEQSDLPPGPISPIDIGSYDTMLATTQEEIEESHEPEDPEEQEQIEEVQYVHANGPTEVDYVPGHDDDAPQSHSFSVEAPAEVPQSEESSLDETPDESHLRPVSDTTTDAQRSLSPAHIMAHASQHTQQLGLQPSREDESELPTPGLMEDIPSEFDRLMSSDQTLFNLEMPSDETASQISTPRDSQQLDRTKEDDPSSAAGETDTASSMRYSGKGALDSDAMYAMFGKDPDVYSMSKDSLTSSVDETALDEPCEELEFFKTSQDEQEQLIQGVLVEDEEPDEELQALAEESEEPSPVPADFQPAAQDDQQKTPEQFDLKPDPIDIERPMSPIPQSMYDDEGKEDTEASRELEEEEEGEEEEEEPEEEHRDPTLQAQASQFVHAVMAEATATVRAERSHKSNDSDDDIPEITITQHLHAETDQDDYPISYAPREVEVQQIAQDFDELQDDIVLHISDESDEEKETTGTKSFLEKGQTEICEEETKSDTNMHEVVVYADEQEFVLDMSEDTTTIEDHHSPKFTREADLHSPEDFGETSSVDSFATVVPSASDADSAMDRLQDVASLTSSFASDMHSSVYDEQLQEPIFSVDARDPEPLLKSEQDHLSESSTSSEKLDITGKLVADDESSSSSKGSPDEDQYDIVQAEDYEGYLQEEPGYILIPRRELEVVKEESEGEQKDSSGTSSSGKMDITTGTTNSSERVSSSPHSPDVTGRKFFGKSGERDDISVSSSLLEFEQLETELQEKTSSDSVPGSGSYKYSKERGLERDDASVTSSLAEFERLERMVGVSDSFERMGQGVLLECAETSSTSSLAEFEKIEQELLGDSDGNLDKASVKSSTSSLLEFERLEEEITIDEELATEAQKVVTLLESGSLVGHRSSGDMSHSSPKESISQEQLIEPSRQSCEEIDKDSLGESEGEVEAAIQEAARNVEAFESPVEATEAVLVTRQLQEAIRSAPDEADEAPEKDSLDGRDDEEFKRDQSSISTSGVGAVVFMSPVSPESLANIVPAERSTHEVDQDSLQDSESHSQSVPMDTDSLHDQDSVMQISAESFEFDPVGPTMSTSMDSHDLMQRSYDSAGLMERSVDSLELGMRVPQGEEGLMERSVDSLELETQVPQSQSRESFDGDSLQEKDDQGAAPMVESWTSVPRHIRAHGRMEVSTESGAFSQTSSIISQDTLVSSDSGRDIMRMSVESPEHEKKRTVIIAADIMDTQQEDSDKDVSLCSLKEVAASGEEVDTKQKISTGLAEADPKVTIQQPFRGVPQSPTDKILSSPSSESSHPDSIQQQFSFEQASLETRRPVDQRPILSRGSNNPNPNPNVLPPCMYARSISYLHYACHFLY